MSHGKQTIVRLILVGIYCAVVSSFPAIQLNAQAPVAERKDLQVDQDKFREVAGELRCPTCTGLSVLDSDASFSVQIKNQVREQMVAGKSEKEILSFFVERYGPWILRSPPPTGVNSLAWIVPISSLICGPLLIWFMLGRRKIARGFASGDTGSVLSTEEIVRGMKQQLEAKRDLQDKKAGLS